MDAIKAHQNIGFEVTEAMPELRWDVRVEAIPHHESVTGWPGERVTRILQQLYKTTEYVGDKQVSGRTEWRDVPDAPGK